ncbi:hypothetical protein N0V85_005131 [Neurospora sp. IMI 360204]|nr:hypothetical protein N0V85_005131 [Neurospora sp. IMI 360204]
MPCMTGQTGGITFVFESNLELYKKDGGIRQKVDAFYGRFRTSFNEEQPVISTNQDVEDKFAFCVVFVGKLDKLEDELITFKDAFKEFLGELAALRKEHQNKRVKIGDHNSPLTEE